MLLILCISEPRGGLFIVILFATENIRRGSELFCQPFLGQWHTACHREMFLSSRISHHYHKWALRLEQALTPAGVEWDARQPLLDAIHPLPKPKILTHEEEERFLTIPGEDRGVLPLPLPLDESMRVVTLEDAMSACGCEFTATAQMCSISEETQKYIDVVGQFIPDYLDIVCKHQSQLEQGEEEEEEEEEEEQEMAAAEEEEGAAAEESKEQGGDDADAPILMDTDEDASPAPAAGASAAAAFSSSAAASSAAAAAPARAGAAASPKSEPRRQVIGEIVRVKVDRAAVLEVVRLGVRNDLVELREDLGIHSPVRHFTPPNYRAFCVVAKKNISQGTFLFCYGGEITEEIVNRDSCYVYTIERDQVSAIEM